MKAFDKDGNEIDVFSQEELDIKIKEANDTAIAAAKAEAEAAAAPAAQQQSDDIPEWAKQLIAKVDSVSTRETLSYVDKVSASLDADRRKIVGAKFSSRTGYDETPEGMARRAEDAYLLATGEKFNAGTVDINNLAAAGGGRTNTDVKAVTDADKNIQAALGVTAADVEKFGKK